VNPNSRPPTNILIVDDDPSASEALASWFRAARCTVRTASSCAQATVLSLASFPEYLIVEQRLADGSGFDLLPRIKAVNPGVIGIVLTRTPAVAAAVHAIRSGFRDYLAKPIEARRLGAILGIAGAGPGAAAGGAANDVLGLGFDEEESASLARVEWEHIHAVLLDCGGNISEAARVLGLHRRSLQRKLRRNSPPLNVSVRPRPLGRQQSSRTA
jgi:two-component system, response regulator RegA